MIVRFKAATTFQGKDYKSGEEALLSDAAVEALGDKVESLEDRHQFGERPVNPDAEQQRQEDAANAGTDIQSDENTPGLSTKDMNRAPKDTQVKSAPAKK